MKVLVIDDDRAVCSSLNLLLKRKGYAIQTIHQPVIAEETILTFAPEMILLDMNFTIDTSGKQGLRLLKRIREISPKTSVILMTGWATVQLAVEGMKLGAKDFIAKPWDNKDLINSIESIQALYHERTMKEQVPEASKSSNIVGQSHGLLEIMDMVERVAKTEASVLITGESGTGKELIAEAIHAKSLRAEKPFVKVNLGGISTELFESELFGHKKGAFTGAHQDRYGRFTKANSGTIFLDEIGELSLTNQVKMLRVLQEKTFEPLGSSNTIRTDVRIVSATNRPLMNMVYNEEFREDLFYRINLITIHLPALRERRNDIPLLVKYFLKNLSEIYNVMDPLVTAEAMQWLKMQEYKGNIRELKNIVERTFLMNMGSKDLGIKEFEPSYNMRTSMQIQNVGFNLEKLEVQTIKKALARHNNSISAASKALGITRSSLYRRLEKYNISHEPQA